MMKESKTNSYRILLSSCAAILSGGLTPTSTSSAPAIVSETLSRCMLWHNGEVIGGSEGLQFFKCKVTPSDKFYVFNSRKIDAAGLR